MNTEGDRQAHWEKVYQTKKAETVSWYTPSLVTSIKLISSLASSTHAPIIDVGGGVSTLAQELSELGYDHLTVLDLSETALRKSEAALRSKSPQHADQVTWLTTDILAWKPDRIYSVWHDRAAFHFLTSAEDRRRYFEIVHRAVGQGDHLVLATFGPDGPTSCSNLPVWRSDERSLNDDTRGLFQMLSCTAEAHTTPGGNVQKFIYSTFERL